MKRKALVRFGVTVLGCSVILGLAFLFVRAGGIRGPTATSARGGSMAKAMKILPAAHAYAQTLRRQGAPVPAFVNANELVARGLLRPDDVKNFAGMELSVATWTAEDRPTNVLMRARRPDGSTLELLKDGSVHEGRP